MNLKEETDYTMNALSKTLALFQQEQMDVIPFEGSWTPGQVAEHVLKAATGICATLQGKASVADRSADEQVESLTKLFSDLSIKMKSPDFLIPQETYHNRESLLLSIEKIHADLNRIIEKENLVLMATGTTFPSGAYLTRLEWLRFLLVHTQRHIQQLKNIYSFLNLSGK